VKYYECEGCHEVIQEDDIIRVTTLGGMDCPDEETWVCPECGHKDELTELGIDEMFEILGEVKDQLWKARHELNVIKYRTNSNQQQQGE
jgi:hypothetical protein